jgi:NTP pyrophosphatase (non-canonical NTP hydrolase)
MRELINNVLEWAQERKLLDNKDADRQALKAVTELGEFIDEILKGNKENQVMELGDVIVTLILTGHKLDIDIEDALASAYDKISKRTGRTVNGVFIKD